LDPSETSEFKKSKTPPNIDASNFMLEEYKTIAAAFFDLSSQKSQMFRFYLILVAIPITLISALIGINNNSSIISSLTFRLPLFVSMLIIIVSISGYLMTLIIADIRFECILYAKTVNLIRRFFVDIDEEVKLNRYLVLPIKDSVPTFYESLLRKESRAVSATFLEMILMGILNTSYFFIGFTSILLNIYCWMQSFIYSTIISVIVFISHYLSYKYLAKERDKNYDIKFE